MGDIAQDIDHALRHGVPNSQIYDLLLRAKRVAEALQRVMPYLNELMPEICEGEPDDEPVGHYEDPQTGETAPLPLTFGDIRAARAALTGEADG